MSEVPEDNLLVHMGECLDHPVDLDQDECFEPLVPRPPAPQPIPKPKHKSLGDLMDEMRPELGLPPLTKSNLPTSASAEVANAAQIPAVSINEQLPPSRVATATEVFTWIKKALLAETSASEDAAELIAYWVISTWNQPALTLRPCLVLTGPAHEASRVLHVLKDVCCLPALLADFGRSHLETLRCFLTNLISGPNLDKRTANLLSSLTDAKCLVVTGSSLARYSKSAAIYAGEDPQTYRIQNSIPIHLNPTSTASTPAPGWVHKTTERLPIHLKQYSEKNLALIKQSTWAPSGLSSEMTVIAIELGRCIVDAPKLRENLITLLRTQDEQRVSDMYDTIEAALLEAVLNLCHLGKPKFLVGEIAKELNRLLKARGERLTLTPTEVGHLLKKIHLTTRRISKDGRGLVMDLATVKQVHQLAKVYGCAGLNQNEQNLHCPQCAETKDSMQLM